MILRLAIFFLVCLTAGCNGTAFSPDLGGPGDGDARVPTDADKNPTGDELPEQPEQPPVDNPEWVIKGIGQDDGIYRSASTATTFDMHALLTDADLVGSRWVTPAQVQGYLVSRDSFLAGYRDPETNKLAATLIVENAAIARISPLYMMARIETESRGITSTVANNLDKATGCGCPDSGSCSETYKGFAKQIECAALLMRGYLREIKEDGHTRTGWAVDVTKKTSDPCSVTPQSRATAALYTYTPWVGAYGQQCGVSEWGGSSLVARIYTKFVADYTWGDAAAPAGTCISGTLGRNIATGTCVQSARDGLWRICVNGLYTRGADTKPTSCVAEYPYCTAPRLAGPVAARSCREKSDGTWLQCSVNGTWVAAPTATTTGGPEGPCLDMYPF